MLVKRLVELFELNWVSTLLSSLALIPNLDLYLHDYVDELNSNQRDIERQNTFAFLSFIIARGHEEIRPGDFMSSSDWRHFHHCQTSYASPQILFLH